MSVIPDNVGIVVYAEQGYLFYLKILVVRTLIFLLQRATNIHIFFSLVKVDKH